MNALKLFRAGHCYHSIAAALGTTEAVIERVIHKLREAERMENRKRAASVRQCAKRLLMRKEELSEIRRRSA